jgi:hypothetical protein
LPSAATRQRIRSPTAAVKVGGVAEVGGAVEAVEVLGQARHIGLVEVMEEQEELAIDRGVVLSVTAISPNIPSSALSSMTGPPLVSPWASEWSW